MKTKYKLILFIFIVFISNNLSYSQKVTIPSFKQEFYMYNAETMVYDYKSTNDGKATVIFDLNPNSPTINLDHGNEPFNGKIIFVSLPGKQSEEVTAITIKYTDNDNYINYAIYKFNEDIEFSTLEFNYFHIKTLYQIYDPTKQLQKQLKVRLEKLRESLKK